MRAGEVLPRLIASHSERRGPRRASGACARVAKQRARHGKGAKAARIRAACI